MSETATENQFSPSIWRRLIAILRLISIALFTVIIASTLALMRLVFSWWPTAKQNIRYWYFVAWSRGICWLLGGQTKRYGRLPNVQCIIASNHLSYLDILVIAQFVPAVFVSKADVKSWPVIGWLTTLADTLYIERERHRDIPRANRSIAQSLSRGDNVVLFPEGTSSDSDWILPVRPPLLQVAAAENYVVSTAALHYRTKHNDPHARAAICYFGDMAFGVHVWRLLHLRGFNVDLRFSGDELCDDDRKTLALKVRRSILSLQAHNKPTQPMPAFDESYAFRKHPSHG